LENVCYLDFDVVDTSVGSKYGTADQRREYVLGEVATGKAAFDKLENHVN
jgi:hypothetical protein